ncbi:zinc-binding dehydrogenase [Nocardioides sp.]|uniref:zinc-binding dehydrogenase n=1 Tax=Nocardioides sp. TaxID=35761 RepID=UPI0039E6AC10
MRAIRQHELGPADVLRLEEIPAPEPAPGQLRIKVAAAGVHVVDTSIRAGRVPPTVPPPELPMTPGREVAGLVDAVGEGVAEDWLGQSVVAHLGSLNGGYAEQALAEAGRAYRVPAGLDAATAVAAIGTGRTAAGVLRLADLRQEDTVAVTAAAGGIGLIALQAGRNAGARTIALAGGPEKTALALRFGADAAIDYRQPGWARQLPPLTVVLDAVGGETGMTLYRALLPGGRLVRYGWAPGAENVYDDPERRLVEVLGPFMTEHLVEFERDSLAEAADGSRVPYVGSVFPLDRAADAHRAVEARATTGKVVLVP